MMAFVACFAPRFFRTVHLILSMDHSTEVGDVSRDQRVVTAFLLPPPPFLWPSYTCVIHIAKFGSEFPATDCPQGTKFRGAKIFPAQNIPARNPIPPLPVHCSENNAILSANTCQIVC